MRCLLFLCLGLSICTPLFADELRLLSDTSETWRARDTPQLPANDRENLALRAAVAETTVSQDRLTAHYLGQRNSLDLVSVDEAPESEIESFHAVSSYQIRDGKIWYDTNIKYVAKPDPENELVAREVARDHLLGRGGQMPVFFNDRMYVVEYDGKCLITVSVKDESTVHFTFRYSCCK